MSQKQDVVIVGAGLAGLTAALHLAQRGITSLVLEADPKYPGGRLAGGEPIRFEHDDKTWEFQPDHGVHGFWEPYQNLIAMLERNDILPSFSPAREETWIYKRRGEISHAAVGSAIRTSWLPAPLHYLNLFLRPRFWLQIGVADILSLPAVLYGLFFAVGIDPIMESQPLQGYKLSYLVKYWGPAVRSFLVGLARNGLSGQPDEIPLSGFLGFLRFYTVMRKDSWNFNYLQNDSASTLINPMLEKLNSLGVKVELNTRLRSLEKDLSGWKLITNDKEIDASEVILATDSPNAKDIFLNSGSLSKEVDDYYWPEGIETAVIRIWFSRTPRPGSEAGIFSGDFILNNYFWLNRIYSQYFEWYRETGGSVLEVHIYGPPELLQEEDAGLLARAISNVRSAFPELKGTRVHQTLTRNLPTHTVFGVGPRGKHMTVRSPFDNLFVCGDWVWYPSPAYFMERSVVTAIAAANEILLSRELPPWKLIEPKPPDKLAALIQWLIRSGRKLRRKRKGFSE